MKKEIVIVFEVDPLYNIWYSFSIYILHMIPPKYFVVYHFNSNQIKLFVMSNLYTPKEEQSLFFFLNLFRTYKWYTCLNFWYLL